MNYFLSESSVVEETKDLVPNLHNFTKAIFGDNSFFIDWQSSHKDWATNKLKRGDGLIWLPWKSQLWIIEVEWKEASNFFDQSRAFAKSKINADKFKEKLQDCLEKIEGILNEAAPGMQEGFISNNIIKQTLKKHIKDGYLLPHGWILLGHDGNNIDKLRDDYEAEVSARFKGHQQYIVSTARMFRNDFSTFFLLEHVLSKNCNQFLTIPTSTLLQGKTTINDPSFDNITFDDISENNLIKTGNCDLIKGNRTKQIEYFLKSIYSNFNINNTILRINISESLYHDFRIDWNHNGTEFLIFAPNGVRKKPANAAKEVFGDQIPSTVSNIARKYSSFLDSSVSPPKVIASYKDVEHSIWKSSKLSEVNPEISNRIATDTVITYFQNINPHKQKKIISNIIERRKLWDIFLDKKEMTSTEFKRHSEFKPKAIAGFIHFLTHNGITTRFGDVFTLKEEVIPYIRKILDENQ